MSKDTPNAMRLKYQYRKMILKGKVKLPIKDAIKLVGRDTAYHLYFSHASDDSKGKDKDND